MNTQPLTRSDHAPPRLTHFTVERVKIRGFVDAFYAKVRQDGTLAPVFERIVADQDWPTHMETMTDFWSAVAFGGSSFRGDPMTKHARIRDISPRHFEHWLAIFETAAKDYWPQDIASLLIFRAQQIAPALLRAVDRAREKQLVTASDLH